MVGKCFYYDTPPNGTHLFVVLAPSSEQAGWFICVNITTKRENSDATLELRQGEHSELTAPVSIVLYAQARALPATLIDRYSEQQRIPNLPPDLLRKIQTAPLNVPSRLKNRFKADIKLHLGIL